MFFTIAYILTRIWQIVFLIPCVGMMAWFVHGYQKEDILAPDYILAPFIISVLALAYTLVTFTHYHKESRTRFIGLIDALFLGAFILSLWYMRHVPKLGNCSSLDRNSEDWNVHFAGLSVSGPSFTARVSKPCAMLKAVFAFHILLCLTFAYSAVVAGLHDGDKYRRRSRNRSHHSRSRSRSHSHHPRHSTSQRRHSSSPGRSRRSYSHHRHSHV